VCRLIGGDLSLVPKIEARNQFWQETEARRGVQRALLEERPVLNRTEQEERTPREADVRDELARRGGASRGRLRWRHAPALPTSLLQIR
jgi:hypothetical protein